MNYLRHRKRINSLKILIRTILWGFASILVLILIIAMFTLTLINDQPINTYNTVAETQEKLEHLKIVSIAGKNSINAGWAAVNITPEEPIDLAGYGPRGPYQSVLDSLYARIIVFDNHQTKAVMISLDLLMFPRLLKLRIEEELSSVGFEKERIFLTATHTHHGFGNWEQSIAGEFAFGRYDQEMMATLVDKIIKGVQKAENTKSKVQIGCQKIDAGDLVHNRLAPETGSKDPYLRIIHLLKDSGEKGMLISFSGHATNLDADNWELSRDFPGVLIEHLEADSKVDFAMFGAGMVGSHNIQIDFPKGHQRIQETGRLLANKIKADLELIDYDSATSIGGMDIDIGLPKSQLRLTKNIVVRDWVFRTIFGPLNANIKVLTIGDILFIGMPCDYSGELSINNQLDEYAKANGKYLFVTSFNGNYVGYITEDMHYNTCNHDEVKTMNWVGPHMGIYFTDAIKKIIEGMD